MYFIRVHHVRQTEAFLLAEMDVYFKKSPVVVTSRTLVMVGGALDLCATMYMVVLHLVRALSVGLLDVSTLLLALAVFHGLQSPAAIAAVITALDPSYVFGVGVIAVFSLLLDATTLILRGSFDTGETPWFQTAAIIGVSVWVALDVYLIVTTTVFSAWLVRWRSRLDIAIKKHFGSEFLANQFYKLPKTMFRARRVLDAMWQVDLFVTILLFVVFVLGLDPTETFSALIVLQAPHLFLWYWYRGVVGGPTDDLPMNAITSTVFLGIVFAFVTVDIGLVAIAASWRTYELVSGSHSTLLLVTGSVSTAISWLLLIVDIVVLGALSAYRSGVDQYHDDRQELTRPLQSAWEKHKDQDDDDETLVLPKDRRTAAAVSGTCKTKQSDVE